VIEDIPEESTAQPDPAEPAGDQDPATEQEYDEAKEEAVEEAASAEPDPAADAARYLELAQRTQAELENLRKRAARDVLQAGARAKANLVRELLPVVDNLERALATANPEEDHLAEGVRLVHAELVGTLERNGIKAFDPAGEPFDPQVHEAISMREGANGSGIVLDVVEKGYKLGDNVIRPARVVVSS
jgi:molecular chaperone GrpE